MTDGTGVSSSVSDLHADAAVLVGRQQVIDHVEALLALGIVDAADVDEADEAAFGIVAQEGQHADDLGGLGLQRQLAIGDRLRR